MMQYLIAAAIGILSLAVVFTLAPTIGGNIEAMSAIPAGSQWNASVNTNIPEGAETWETLSPFLIIIGLVICAAIVLIVLRGVG